MTARIGRWPVRALALVVGAAIGYAAWTLRDLAVGVGIGDLPVGQPLAVAGLLIAVVLGARGSDRVAAAAPSAGWLLGVAAAGVVPAGGWDRYGIGLLVAAALATAALARLAPQPGLASGAAEVGR